MTSSLNKVPKHIGIIIDGNRRFAKRLMLSPWKGHELGYEKVEKLFDWCKELGIKELTLYAFSIENFDRPKLEFDYLMKLFKDGFNKLLNEDKEKIRDTCINFIGRINMFPEDLQEVMYKLMDVTKDNIPFKINLAMAYGGRTEIIDATKKIAEQVKDNKLNINNINEEVFKNNLYLSSEPELIIRTSESRLSGFLTFQSVYSELIFLPEIMWPEFEKETLIKCLEEYYKRERRFGK